MEFPSNSHNVNDPKPPKAEGVKKVKKEPIEKVVTSEVVRRKKPIGQKLKSIFLGGEMRSASNYVFSEVLLPALRNLVVDTTSKGIERVIYGESNRGRRPDYNNRSRVSYNTMSSPDRYGRDPRARGASLPDQPPHYGRKRQEINEIVINSRNDANLVIDRLGDIIDKYDVASVADFYDLLGLPTSWTDNGWGWTALPYANVRQTRDGFVIDLPPAEPV